LRKSSDEQSEEVVGSSAWAALAGRLLSILPNHLGVDWAQCTAGYWQRGRWSSTIVGFQDTQSVSLDDLLHVDAQKAALFTNTQQLLADLPANNALLWGARGTGKSSLVHGVLAAFADQGLRLVEVGKEALVDLAEVIESLADQPYRFIVFCDDLSFEDDDASYKSLKSVLEGSVLARASNVVIYATSNRRHLLAEKNSDNAASGLVDGELHHGEAVEEKISLSDRFGLWLSFYPVRQNEYLDMVRSAIDRLVHQYASAQTLRDEFSPDYYRQEALRWALARGVRNGRSAEHFARHWVGQQLLKQSST
jgi:predicted AAA+ superfamily ATPase